MTTRCRIVAVAVVVGVSALAAAQQPTITGTGHDLSTGSAKGPNVCLYCHIPHMSNPSLGLWSHQVSNSQYQMYDSSVSTTYAEGPSSISTTKPSPSRLCMSCHDGTVALGAVNFTSAPLPTAKTLTAADTFGTNLQSSHPMAFDQWNRDNTMLSQLFTSNPRATANVKVQLWNGRIECTTCHEPHTPNLDPQRSSMFLSLNNANGALCLSCHDASSPSPNVLAGWTLSAHVVSTTSEGASTTGYATVAQGACLNCHTPHTAGSVRLLKNGDEKACFPCHANSSSMSRWAQVWVGNTDATKFMHPVQASGHVPAENLLAASTPRHSKCWDCHNAHAMKLSSTSNQPLQASMTAATGLDVNGNVTSPAAHAYEVCYKCHADSTNKPQKTGYAAYGYTPTRQVDSHNVRLDFNSLIARHNVAQQRSALFAPDDRPNILNLVGSSTGRNLTSGVIYCSDCHNGNNPTSDGGTGPNGPHISAYPHILERPYAMNQPAPIPGGIVASLVVPPGGGDPLNGPFALCNKCHDVAGLLNGTSDVVFKHHGSHVVQGGISCSVCHAAHGVQGTDSQHHANLLNLDVSIVGPDPTTNLLQIDTVNRTCYVSCHFSNDTAGLGNHSGVSYNAVAATPALQQRTRSIPGRVK